ncbi:ATP-binding protein [Pedobacter endophyticus]|uniref:ATP-binding protein n=1 Tax=Pedobacter endophyticus TaxID=2789740 RepID=A0A7U3Q5L7_9SPHI|nr:ATP-binding protein [Pedobacter endophyticus]QPH38927.1 ATP-binding protein [Pedobacter endophyticus]
MSAEELFKISNPDLQPKSNIANKVRNTSLPKTKPLLPLYEAISNSIHSIKELSRLQVVNGRIIINLIRNGSSELLKDLPEVDDYPIHSIEIIDNGLGFNDDNMGYFIEADTDHKIEIGGKGVGRFVCLKAFKKIEVKSHFEADEKLITRTFEYRNTKEGIHNFDQSAADEHRERTTRILLSEYREEYQKHVPMNLFQIARDIVSHFLLYFIEDSVPEIIVRNQNNHEVNCKNLYNTEFQKEIQMGTFIIPDSEFKLYLTKSYKSQSHKIHYCAHHRSVKEEGLISKIPDLGKYSIKEGETQFYYQAYVVSNFLDNHVDTERVGFDFPTDDDEEEMTVTQEITLYKIRNKAVDKIEELLSDYLSEVRETKINNYRPTVNDELPQYRAVFKNRLDEVKKLPPSLPKQKLDIELYRIEANWKIEVKEEAAKLIEERKDIQNLEEYKNRYEKFLQQFNEIGQVDLARYIVHRKTVIDLLDQFLNINQSEKFQDEDIIHNIFFPIKSNSDEVLPENQNLWLLDERLTYHTFLSSDKSFDKINELEVQSHDRTDLIIYNDALAFSEDKRAPHNSFTIVEFKKPQRNNFHDYDSEKNPMEQCERYIESLLMGKVKDRTGRFITVEPNTPFYVYIVCDITPSLEKILRNREYIQTPDKLGYFTVKSQYYKAYIEVLPFEKVLKDAQKRNRILFDKLGIS